jgi:hypothetical protein
MESEEPEDDELVERVQRFAEWLARFEQNLRTMNVPPAEPQDTDAATPPAPGEASPQAEDHGQALEGP